MSALWFGELRFTPLIATLFLALAIVGCEDGNDGADGLDGINGAAGPAGGDGISCWDLNENGVEDPEEDLNGDGAVDVFDCNPTADGAYTVDKLHSGYFTEHNYDGTQSCLNCHGLIGQDMLMRAHFTWEGTSSNITGHEGHIHGKNDLINNFCIAVPSNEGRCTQCHAGYGYADNTFNFGDMQNVDCLICHDQTDTYKKGKTTAGQPDPAVDLNAVARSVTMNEGVPQIKNCIVCHANAGGGDNVKHGDLAMDLLDTTREFDVHLGTDGAGYNCVDCHAAKKDADENVIDHGMAGMPYHSIDEGDMKQCVDCHGDAASNHVRNANVAQVVSTHPTLACQVCHIPTFARKTSTKVEWYWEDAGQDITPPIDPATNRPTYDKKKGTFVWANNVRPTLLYFDGKWNRRMIGENDTYTATPVDLASPSATYQTAGAMIYPFKKMIGNQVADAGNQTLLVPHLFGPAGGPNWYWKTYDWDLALQDGAAYTGQTYSGAYEFVDTFMYLTVNHEVAPKEQAYGQDGNCSDCHGVGLIDWAALGWSDNPVFPGATRP